MRPLSTDLSRDDVRPYFLWDEDISVGELRRVLKDGPTDERDRLLAKMLREASDLDVWAFVTPEDVAAALPRIESRLGRRRAFWRFLIDGWREDGLLPPPKGAAPEQDSPLEDSEHVVPEISRFYGVVIRMFFNDHDPPHFHAAYGADEALISIDTLEVLRGRLPRRALGLVLEWAALHREELREDWARARAGEALEPIEPLE